MRRSIRRGMAKANGTFEAQKPLRDKTTVSFKSSIINAFIGAKHVAALKDEKKLSFTDYVKSIFGRRVKEAK
jgi:hypothetical protein